MPTRDPADPVDSGPTALDLDAIRVGLEAAVEAAAEAIREVIEGQVVHVAQKYREGPVTDADHAADDVLHRLLMPLIDGAQWLSEESKQDAPLLHGEPTWVVDPLDGTREFLRGIPEFGVSVGLFVDDALVLGAVALPVQEQVMSGLVHGDRREARIDDRPLPALPDGGRIDRVVVSRHDYERRQLQHHIPYEVYPCGSAAVKLAHAATGEADVYFSTGPRSVWDVAGGAAVLEGAGGAVLTFDGEPLKLSPHQVPVPPYMAGAAPACLAFLRRLGAEV
ncbi:MAG: inositol monophosphatase family protein [Dehalococcoidia bacterium]|nr:inositol monophosphatase family protein [Dehalococcoidia bacterium]